MVWTQKAAGIRASSPADEGGGMGVTRAVGERAGGAPADEVGGVVLAPAGGLEVAPADGSGGVDVAPEAGASKSCLAP